MFFPKNSVRWACEFTFTFNRPRTWPVTCGHYVALCICISHCIWIRFEGAQAKFHFAPLILWPILGDFYVLTTIWEILRVYGNSFRPYWLNKQTFFKLFNHSMDFLRSFNWIVNISVWSFEQRFDWEMRIKILKQMRLWNTQVLGLTVGIKYLYDYTATDSLKWALKLAQHNINNTIGLFCILESKGTFKLRHSLFLRHRALAPKGPRAWKTNDSWK